MFLLPLLLLVVTVGGSIGAAGAGFGVAKYSGYSEKLPDNPQGVLEDNSTVGLGPARIFDRNGTLLYEFEDETEGLRKPLKLADISSWVVKATIATEDASFFENPGVNVRGLARAGIENFIDRESGASGGSSITQQLVKNVFVDPELRYERSPDRKLQEAVFALELTKRYSKEQILEWYLNWIPYGNRTNGIGAAAKRYYNSDAKNLTLAQATLLVGLPQSPVRYDPFRNFDSAKARQAEVLDLMVRHSVITQLEADRAKEEPISLATPNVILLAPHWVFYVRDLALAQFGEDRFRRSGFNIYTSLDLNLQNKAQQILEEKIAFYESPRGGDCRCHNGAVVAIDNNTGEILAMVGSRDYWRKDIEGENNNALAIKQPGSAFKPMVYLSAFEKGWNPGTTIYDQPTKFVARVEAGRKEFFTPEGPVSRWLGPLSARDSLGSSMNTAAVKAAGFAGIDAVIDTAHALGITSLVEKENYGVSIATGGANLTLLDLAYAYATIANNGEMRGATAIKPREGGLRGIDPVAILRVEDGRGRVVYEFTEPARKQVVPAAFAYEVTDILKDPQAKRHTYNAPEAQFGMRDGRPIASKTGTQQGPTDIKTVLSTWNFGYVPDLTVGVWVGNANNALVNPNLTSASSSLLIWKEFMQAAIEMRNIPRKEFAVPREVEFTMVNGKREPVLRGQKVLDKEDLKLWEAAGNPPFPTFGSGGGTVTPTPAPFNPGGGRTFVPAPAPPAPAPAGLGRPTGAFTAPPVTTPEALPVANAPPVSTPAPAPTATRPQALPAAIVTPTAAP